MSFGRLDPDLSFPTEPEIEQRLVELFGETNGLALVAASAQNIARMVSLYRACKRTRRTLVIDLYTAEMLRATDNAHIPQSDWPGVALYIPQYQRVQIKRSGTEARLMTPLDRPIANSTGWTSLPWSGGVQTLWWCSTRPSILPIRHSGRAAEHPR